jgi:hypothetical protein
MKTIAMKAFAPLVAAMIVIPAVAQEAPQPPIRPDRQERPRVVPPQVPMEPRQDRRHADALDKNITIRLNGILPVGEQVDLSLTGVGPMFSTDSPIGKEGAVTHFEYMVEPEGAAYRVNFSISTRIRVAIQRNGDAVSYEFMDIATNGNVLCEAGKAVGIYKGQDGGLFLSVGDAEEEKPE